MPLERISQGFKDISMSFQTNPLTDDLIVLKDANAIARSVRNIVLTTPGEKFFDPNYGTNISESLFENLNVLTADVIKSQIQYSIERLEPRVRYVDCVVSADEDNGALDVTLTYEIIGLDIEPQDLQFILQPTR